MTNMIRADFYRIVRSKGILIAVFLLLLMIALDVYMVSPGSLSVGVSTQTVTENEMSGMTYEEFQSLGIRELRKIKLNSEGYALDRDFLANNMNLYYIFIFVAAVVIAADFSGGTAKNTLSSAISRKKYFLSKLVFTNLCCLFLFFLNTYVLYFANLLFNNTNVASDIGTITKITLLQLPPILALVSILTGLAFLLKKTAAFNTVAIPLEMVFQLVMSLLTTLFSIKAEWLSYTIQQMIVRLTLDPSNGYIVRSYLVCGVVMAACYALGYLSFQKAEIR